MEYNNFLLLVSSKLELSKYLFLFWVLPWKIFSIYKAVKNKDKWWTLALIIISNKLALLEMMYIFVFSKRKVEETRKNVGNKAMDNI